MSATKEQIRQIIAGNNLSSVADMWTYQYIDFY